ncbi:30S ribosomal protein S3 [Candidatus Azambacteria bacterium RIFOXYD1_FULL_42_11]|uniref:Small ribosomal subunit protein uS3 n=4 Tax=root TaxID=1 RepID=A0A0G1BHT4_9BACT|nr:30S ribosomal protein S3 [uncultured organism]KKS44155.1 MAG: 30S ribosomal protein S3 [Candidatus Azambacteria bacterium GW2011_GWB1_42_17]KKS45861.1 MAG: 30S ribosomal protein S3 [Candidatus Azambacteria bacterium GW2011_GWA1_42_19]KKS88329.1 MAG: 30S ribosomal protein S3 [Parcubacteria group bacterium GW2011_GWC1_43_11]OGD41977.1 MAG: 30S ribosomal protein S3 [Candidatus Azambacteria bacterium RIFOXYD1_FULL_42_11]
MGNKIHPINFRLGIIQNWRSRWLNKKSFRFFLEEDLRIREYLKTGYGRLGLGEVEIERSGDNLSVILNTAKPGLIIGRGGTGLTDLKKKLESIVKNAREKKRYGTGKWDLKLTVNEIKKPETDAKIVAQNIASDLEKRMPFRRVMKSTLERIMSQKGVLGAKIFIAGRLDGSEMARREWLSKGKVPLQTIRAGIDYALDEAMTVYGKIGVKVWIYKGEVFDAKASQK